MTSGTSKNTALWSDLLLRSMAELRELYNQDQQRLDEHTQEDFSRLFEGSTRLDEMLQDLIIAAVNDALNRSQEMISSEMSKLTGGMNIPGLT